MRQLNKESNTSRHSHSRRSEIPKQFHQGMLHSGHINTFPPEADLKSFNRVASGDRYNSGAAMVEFVITFPLVLFVALGIIQLALIYSGQQVVHYAAYCASRAELVEADAERAAEIACIPITSKTRGSASYFYNGIDIGRRLEASAEKTELVAIGYPDLSATIDYHFELIIPVINKLFVLPNEFSLVPWENEPLEEIEDNKTITEYYGSPHIYIRQRATLPKPWKE